MTKFHMDKARAAEGRVSVDFLRDLLDYDAQSGSLKWRLRTNENFNSKYAGTEAGAKHKSGAIQIQLTFDGKGRLFWAHRIAWCHYHGCWPDGLIDHRDGNPSNNKIDNLRLANGSQNGCNKRELRGAIPFRGVYEFGDGKFAAQIKFHGKWRWLGLHSSPSSAAKAYDDAAVNLHGAFAVTNADLGLYRKYEVDSLA